MRYVDAQTDRLTIGTHVRIRDASEVASNESKQVGRNAMRAVKYAVAVAIHDVALEQVPVRKHDRELLRVSNKSRGEAGQNIGAINIVGNIAKAFSFALRDERTIGTKNGDNTKKRAVICQRTCRAP